MVHLNRFAFYKDNSQGVRLQQLIDKKILNENQSLVEVLEEFCQANNQRVEQ